MSSASSSRLAHLLVALGALALAVEAVAAEVVDESFSLERFRPATTSAGINDVESGAIGGHLQWDAALWTNYANDPFVVFVDEQRAGALVAHRIGADLVGSIALFDWVELAAALPLVALQTADRAELPDAIGAFTTQAAGVGDLRIAPKLRVLRAREQLVDLAFVPAFTLPTAQPAGRAWMGEGAPTFVPELAASRDLGVVRFAAGGAWRARFDERTARNLTIGSELVYRVGVGLRLHDVIALPLSIDASLSGATPASRPLAADAAGDHPLELLVVARHDVARFAAARGAGDALVAQAFVGGGAGLAGGVGTPGFRLLAGVRFVAPADVDGDDDRIVDATDRCPSVAEDADGFDDTDGCPDDDNDADGHADGADTCPNEAEDADGFEDADGCPDVDNDRDAVRDRDDACADVAGSVDNKGCPWPDGDGDGVLDRDDACPAVPGVAAQQGCPDKDGDGLVDDVDRCPTLAGPPRPHGGCPDTDRDGFTDDVDRCPAEAETVNNVADDDGCPDEGRVLVALMAQKIEILDKVIFDTGRATIQGRSFALLDQVATVLKTHAELARLRVEGHTDDQGDDDQNRALSQDRATAVVTYLIGKGVDAARLQAVGLGETQPAADNKTAQGREKNRRVEFVIVE